MRRMGLLLLAVLLPTGLAAQATEENSRAVLEDIVARVNNEIITLTDLTRSRRLLREELSDRYRGEELERRLAQEEQLLLRDLIDQSLLIQRGTDLGLSVEADVIKRLDRIRQDMGLKSLEELERAVTAQGLGFEDFRQQLRNQILTNLVIQREVASRVMLDAEEVRHFYLQHREELAQPERVRLREILIATGGTDGESTDRVEARLREVLEKVRAGEPFDQLARQYSDSPTAKEGGNLGEFEPEKLAPAIREAIGNLREGGVADPLRTAEGWLILQLVEHLPAGIPPLEKVEDRIREKLYFDRVQPELREYLAQLRREAFIYVKPGYVDSGAVEPEEGPQRSRKSRRSRRRRE